MATKRMFSKPMVEMDAFSEMSHDAQLLYFRLCMNADDDGFIDNTRTIIRMYQFKEEDLKELLEKRFVLKFEGGICVIKHWFLHNTIPKDRYKSTKYAEEKKLLKKKDDGAYTECIQNVDTLEYQIRLDKVRLGKNRVDKIGETSSPEVPLLIKEFEGLNPASKRFYGNKTQRAACEFLLKTYGFERLKKVVNETLPKTNKIPYFPTITTPVQLQDKWAQLESKIHQYQAENNKSKSQVAF